MLNSASKDLDEAQILASRYGYSCFSGGGGDAIADSSFGGGGSNTRKAGDGKSVILPGQPHGAGSVSALNTTLLNVTTAAAAVAAREDAAAAAGAGGAADAGGEASASSRAAILPTTGGHSNTDHIIARSECPRIDRLSELKRGLKRRSRQMTPESRGQDRWDHNRRIKGSRRRRIKRDLDLPEAPPEPPPSGYVVFIGQMTTKIRHDRPHERHSQVRVVSEISKLWKMTLSPSDREYYEKFATEAQAEYRQLFGEYKATGSYRDTSKFMRLGGNADDKAKAGASTRWDVGRGPWVRKEAEQRNDLERELIGYSTTIFPQRPASVEAPEWEKKREEAAQAQAQRNEKLMISGSAGSAGRSSRSRNRSSSKAKAKPTKAEAKKKQQNNT